MTRALAVLAALLCVAVCASADLGEAGNITAGGNITSGGVISGSSLSLSGTAAFSDISCPTTPQRYTFRWVEGEVQAMAWPDSIVRAGEAGPPLHIFLQAGAITNIAAYAFTSGAGYDSLIIDARVGAVSIFDSPEDKPRILATAADGGNTRAGGAGLRDAVIDPAKREVNDGDALFIEARVFGSASPHPTGLVVVVEFEPNY